MLVTNCSLNQSLLSPKGNSFNRRSLHMQGTRKAALLLVDVQYSFLPGGELAVADGDAILPVVCKLLDEGNFEAIFASQDFHPSGHISFASRHGRQPFTTIEVLEGGDGTRKQELWPDHCVQGTRGADIEESVSTRLTRLKGQIIKKGTQVDQDAYSAFAVDKTMGGLGNEPLADRLHRSGITELFVAGLATDYCVRASVLAALQSSADKGDSYKVYVVREGVRGVDPSATDRIFQEFKEMGAQIISVDGLELQRLLKKTINSPNDTI